LSYGRNQTAHSQLYAG